MKRIHIATVSSPHGVAGEVKLYSLLNNASRLKTISTFTDKQGAPIALKIRSTSGKMPIGRIGDTATKNDADTQRGLEIYVDEAAFPKTQDDEFYAYELVGLKVIDDNNQVIGTVRALHDFGAGDILEIDFFEGESEMIPFKDEFFHDVDMQSGTISYHAPNYI